MPEKKTASERERADLSARDFYNNWRGKASTGPWTTMVIFQFAEAYAEAARREERKRPSYEQGRLDQFIRMKTKRPLDPTYWDAHEERDLREAVAALEVGNGE